VHELDAIAGWLEAGCPPEWNVAPETDLTPQPIIERTAPVNEFNLFMESVFECL
jgi:hypothetical protein